MLGADNLGCCKTRLNRRFLQICRVNLSGGSNGRGRLPSVGLAQALNLTPSSDWAVPSY